VRGELDEIAHKEDEERDIKVAPRTLPFPPPAMQQKGKGAENKSLGKSRCRKVGARGRGSTKEPCGRSAQCTLKKRGGGKKKRGGGPEIVQRCLSKKIFQRLAREGGQTCLDHRDRARGGSPRKQEKGGGKEDNSK